MEAIQNIAIDKIEPNPNQPRKHFDDNSLNELADSIKAKGLLEPIVVRPFGDGYQIVCGERRWRACKIAGLETIQSIIKELDNEEAFVFSLIENMQRNNLGPMEEATAFRYLLLFEKDFYLSGHSWNDSWGFRRIEIWSDVEYPDNVLECFDPKDRTIIENGRKFAIFNNRGYKQISGAKFGDWEMFVREDVNSLPSISEEEFSCHMALFEKYIGRMPNNFTQRLHATWGIDMFPSHFEQYEPRPFPKPNEWTDNIFYCMNVFAMGAMVGVYPHIGRWWRLDVAIDADDEDVKYVRRKCWICDCLPQSTDDALQKESSPDYIHIDDIPEIERLFKKCAFIDISWKNKYIHKMELSQFFEGILQRLHEASTT